MPTTPPSWAGSLKIHQKQTTVLCPTYATQLHILLVTPTLTQSNRPSRPRFAVWSATCWMNQNLSSHHSNTCSCPNSWCGSWTTCGSYYDFILSLFTWFFNWPLDPYCLLHVQYAVSGTTNQTRWCHTVWCLLELKWTYQRSITCIHALCSSVSCFLYSPMKHWCVWVVHISPLLSPQVLQEVPLLNPPSSFMYSDVFPGREWEHLTPLVRLLSRPVVSGPVLWSRSMSIQNKHLIPLDTRQVWPVHPLLG